MTKISAAIPAPDQGQHLAQLVQPALEGGLLRADLLDQLRDAAQFGGMPVATTSPRPRPAVTTVPR
jgi:hypothetical protein